MALPERVAVWIVHRPFRIWIWLGVIVGLAVGVVVGKARLSSDVLDMLPGHFESVGIYKLADREFSSARDLVFALVAETDDVDVDGFSEYFAGELAKESWVVRLMDRSPVDAPGGVDELRAVALPLMLNQEDVGPLSAALQPEAIHARLGKLRAKVEAGVGVSQAELEYDPLGIIFPALKSVGSRNLGSAEDDKFRLIIANCRQDGLDERSCRETMQSFERFKKRVTAEWLSNHGPVPQVLCTGRTAYVAEMAGKLKGDIISTVSSSILLVALTFYAGFRRWRPLWAIVQALAVTCILAVACGAMIFGSLNMITVGLCAILVGLGVDFSMVLYAFYAEEKERGASHEGAIAAALRAHGAGIWFGAITTAGAFLCLLFSGSEGYRQLGVLIACGILIAALAMQTLFWLFLGTRLFPGLRRSVYAASGIAVIFAILWAVRNFEDIWTPTSLRSISIGIALAAGTMFGANILCRVVPRLPAIAFEKPWRLLGPGLFGLLVLVGIAFAPLKPVHFDLDPKSLEPVHSDAGYAMRSIAARLNPDRVESVIAVVEADSQEGLATAWAKIEKKWQPLLEAGTPFRTINTPSALVTSPSRIMANAAKLRELVDFQASRSAFYEALRVNDFPPAQFAAAGAILDALASASAGELNVVDWRKNLPESSAWWFLIDGRLSRTKPLGIAHLKPIRAPANEAEVRAIREALAVEGVKIGFSGWSLTLTELAGWSGRKMTQLTVLMLGLNVILLTILLRSWRPVAVTMLGLMLSTGAMFATLKFTGLSLNLFNILAFPLILGVGVDYAIYIALAMKSQNSRQELSTLMKPLLLSGMTTFVGFSSLAWAENPALRGLGLLCGIGVGWCLLTTFVFVLPACAIWAGPKKTVD
jgi:uncharacterized protein